MTISTAGMIEAVRAAASMTKTQEEQDCLNGIANRIEILAAANADMDLQLNSIRSALNIPDAQSVRSGVIDAFSRKSSDIEELTEKSNRLRRTAKEHHEENQQLRIELAELRGQEPVAYSLRFRDLRGNLEERINTPTTFDKKERADTYGRGSRYLMQPDGSIQEMRDPTRDPVTVPLYAAPVPPAASQLERDVSAVVGLLEEHEWAEHCTKTELGQRLEHAITQLHNEHGEASQPYTVPDERAAYETFIAKRLGDSIDTQRARNGDPEKPDYMAWDMTVGWIAWQGRAAMLQSGNSPVSPDSSVPEGYALVPDGYALVSIDLLNNFPEINICNYNHDDVRELNSWGIELVLSTDQKPTSQVLALTDEKPIIIQRTGKNDKTHWIIFVKGGAV